MQSVQMLQIGGFQSSRLSKGVCIGIVNPSFGSVPANLYGQAIHMDTPSVTLTSVQASEVQQSQVAQTMF